MTEQPVQKSSNKPEQQLDQMNLQTPLQFTLSELWVPGRSDTAQSDLLDEEFTIASPEYTAVQFDAVLNALVIPIHDSEYQQLQRQSIALEKQLLEALEAQAHLPAKERIVADISDLNQRFENILNRAEIFQESGVATAVGFYVQFDIGCDVADVFPENHPIYSLASEWVQVQDAGTKLICEATRQALPEHLHPLTRDLPSFICLGGRSVEWGLFPEFSQLAEGIITASLEANRLFYTEHAFSSGTEHILHDWLLDNGRDNQSAIINLDLRLENASEPSERNELYRERERLLAEAIAEAWPTENERPRSAVIENGRFQSVLITPEQLENPYLYLKAQNIHVLIDSNDAGARLTRHYPFLVHGVHFESAPLTNSNEVTTDEVLRDLDFETGIGQISNYDLRFIDSLPNVSLFQWTHLRPIEADLLFQQAFFDISVVLQQDIHADPGDMAALLIEHPSITACQEAEEPIRALTVRLSTTPPGVNIDQLTQATLELEVHVSANAEPITIRAALFRADSDTPWTCGIDRAQ